MTSVTKKKKIFQYQCIEGRPKGEILQNFFELNEKIFVFNESADNIEKLFNEKEVILGCYAFFHNCLIGFKIGFENEPYVFESWRGGVTKDFRGQGIATHLMKLQHQWCKNKNFRKIITVTNTNNTPMMLLNSKHGFEVIQHTINHRNIQKVYFQKDLQ